MENYIYNLMRSCGNFVANYCLNYAKTCRKQSASMPFTYSIHLALVHCTINGKFLFTHTYMCAETSVSFEPWWFVRCNNSFPWKQLNPRLSHSDSKASGLSASSVRGWFCHKWLFVSELNACQADFESSFGWCYFLDYGRSCVSCPAGHEFLCCCVIWHIGWLVSWTRV